MTQAALKKKFNHATQIIVMCKDLFDLVGKPPTIKRKTPSPPRAPPPPPPPPKPLKLNKSPKKAAVINARSSLMNALKADPKFLKMKQKLNQNGKK